MSHTTHPLFGSSARVVRSVKGKYCRSHMSRAALFWAPQCTERAWPLRAGVLLQGLAVDERAVADAFDV